ncbi:MAG TPA: cell envelope integrity protein CreD [Candidatus Polarisedimenticolaceae bacterium]|nr:cell envelope integrity protein CreD [Candidatus Polarisedimenticolaceae bacterium]
MRRTLLVKAIVTGILAMAVIVPLSAIVSMVHDRQALSAGVLEDVQRAGVGTQTLIGPILIVPYRRTLAIEVTDPKSGAKSTNTTEDEGRLYFLPETLTADVRVSTEMRHRGIYSALLYNAHHTINGSFALPERFGVAENPNATYAFSDPFLILGISDTRGIRGKPTVSWNGAALDWKGGTGGSTIDNGVHAAIGNCTPGKTATFAIDLALQGTQTLAYVPVGKDTAVQMKSDWPHPSFDGQFLPETRAVSGQGFDATWRTTHLASNVESALRTQLGGKSGVQANTFGVQFIEPVNVYLQTERAAKYGFLFVVLTFLVFQLFELLKGLAIHPVQYGLVGMGLAMFFLLLLALTEHLPFALAYLLASAACIALLGFYVSYVLRSVKRATGFTGLLTTLYAALYVLLRSEDMALLLGAALLFGILAAIMVVTRRIDWYRVAVDPTDSGVPETGSSEA